jgi:hypothetical protein
MSDSKFDLPGVFVRKIGGGGRFVPLIGDTQQFSSISCCSTERYDEMTQNSSKFMLGASQFVSVVGSFEDSVDDELDGDDS